MKFNFFIMWHDYEVGNIVKKKDGTLMEITSVCESLFDEKPIGYIICRRYNGQNMEKEKLHVDDVEFVNVGSARSYEIE